MYIKRIVRQIYFFFEFAGGGDHFLFTCCSPYNNLGKGMRIVMEFPRESSKQKSLWMARVEPTTPNLEKPNAWSIEHHARLWEQGNLQVCDLCRRDESDKNILLTLHFPQIPLSLSTRHIQLYKHAYTHVKYTPIKHTHTNTFTLRQHFHTLFMPYRHLHVQSYETHISTKVRS